MESCQLNTACLDHWDVKVPVLASAVTCLLIFKKENWNSCAVPKVALCNPENFGSHCANPCPHSVLKNLSSRPGRSSAPFSFIHPSSSWSHYSSCLLLEDLMSFCDYGQCPPTPPPEAPSHGPNLTQPVLPTVSLANTLKPFTLTLTIPFLISLFI